MPPSKYLHDGRVLLGTVGCNRVLHGLRIAILAGADDFIIRLRVVELLACVLNTFAEVTAQPIPELEFDLFSERRRCAEANGPNGCSHAQFDTKCFHLKPRSNE